MSKNKLYSLLLIACFFGYMYLGFSILNSQKNLIPGIKGCLFKNITTIPCPSCGTTRSIQLLIEGQFFEARMVNPFGFIVAFMMLTVPFWIFADLLLKKQTLFNSYQKTEHFIRTKWIATILIMLVLLNWIWNIYKNL